MYMLGKSIILTEHIIYKEWEAMGHEGSMPAEREMENKSERPRSEHFIN